MPSETTKRKAKDSVFVDLFQDKKNVFRLYQELHPEDKKTTIEDISIQTIEAIFVNKLYNDLGFIAGDNLIMLVEAQSTWNPNMPLRMLFYLAETYRCYLTDTEQNEHSRTKLKLPKPELYVLYSGNRKAPEFVSFKECFL